MLQSADDRAPAAVAAPRRPLQRRSMDAYRRALDAARALVATRDFDAIPIRELAAAAGYSVGNFYYRFGTKDAFFDLLLEEMIARRLAEVRETLSREPIRDLPEVLARGALATHRANAGLLRSAIKKQLAGEGKWERVSGMGREIAAAFTDAVERAQSGRLSPLQREQIAFSFVWLYGLLTQSVLELNTIFGMEAGFFEREAVQAFRQAIARTLGPQPSGATEG